MDEDKDEFLREIDELLGGVGDETPQPSPKSNGVGSANGLDLPELELDDNLNGLTLNTEEPVIPPKSR